MIDVRLGSIDNLLLFDRTKMILIAIEPLLPRRRVVDWLENIRVPREGRPWHSRVVTYPAFGDAPFAIPRYAIAIDVLCALLNLTKYRTWKVRTCLIPSSGCGCSRCKQTVLFYAQ